MADADLPTCMAFIFAAEGGYVDNPLDPGGATNMGITLDVLTAWRHSAVSKADVQALTKDEATAIYHANYWNVLRCSGLPGGIDLMAFDAGVNMGNGRSAKFVQTAVGAAVDGAIGPNTLAAVSAAVAAKGAAAIINALADARNAYYHTLATFDIFGAGWLARWVMRLMARSGGGPMDLVARRRGDVRLACVGVLEHATLGDTGKLYAGLQGIRNEI